MFKKFNSVFNFYLIYLIRCLSHKEKIIFLKFNYVSNLRDENKMQKTLIMYALKFTNKHLFIINLKCSKSKIFTLIINEE